ncbi:hypothetical protein C819_00506 [Lachnospiraceae bacterium 10-1]|nr:hypothetical protein C819_00506 [Lachnospiraceae bacterium 10-1]
MEITRKRTEETNWAKVKELAAAGSLKVGDEISDNLLTGQKMVYVVADITEEEVKFVSKDLLAERVVWNGNGRNTGGFKESDLCRYLNEGVWEILPEELKAVISERECLQIVEGKEERFMLKLWLPSEFEVFGDSWASEVEEGQQFELFKDSRNRVKFDKDGERADWWLLSVCAGHSTHACNVNYDGIANGSSCSYALRVPVCFSIKK